MIPWRFITAEELRCRQRRPVPRLQSPPRSLPRMAVNPPRLGDSRDSQPYAAPGRSCRRHAGRAAPAAGRREDRALGLARRFVRASAQPAIQEAGQGTAPAANPTAKPSAALDSQAAKTAFQLAKGLFKPNTLPAFAFPNLQFMMPLKPFAMKLPFSQKLELELIGRVVPDPEAASEAPATDQ